MAVLLVRSPAPCTAMVALCCLCGAGCLRSNPDFSEDEHSATNAGTSAGTSTALTAGETSDGPCLESTGGFSDPDSELQPIQLDPLDLCEVGSGRTDGTLSAATSSWWISLLVESLAETEIGVTASMEVNSGHDAQLCGFVECLEYPASAVDLACQDGSPTSSPAGRRGCCTQVDTTTGRAHLAFRYQCPSFDTLAYFRADQAPEGPCLPFAINYELRETAL